MDQHNHIPLTVGEVSFLWDAYRCETMFFWAFKNLEQHIDDVDIRRGLRTGIDLFAKHIQMMKNKYVEEGMQVPIATTEHDVNFDAPKLFTDQTVMLFLRDSAATRMEFFAKSIKRTTRKDIRELTTNLLTNYVNLEHQVTEVLLSKGIYVRSPQIPIEGHVDYVKDPDYLTGWLGKRRPLTLKQIYELFANIQRNIIAKTLIMGFSQTVQSEKVRRYLEKGKKKADEVIDSLHLYLADVDLYASIPSGLGITTSTKAPFSDKLVLDLMVNITRCAIEDYGHGLSMSSRRDLIAFYEKTIVGTALYLNENIKLQIDFGYMEEPPKAPDYNEIAKNRDTST